MSYTAFITRVAVRAHPNADKLALGTCMGSQVIVGKDTPDGALGIFFPEGGQLSERMATENRLLKEQGGYLDTNRRIKALRLRGEKSEGLWLPLGSLTWASPYVAEGLFKENEALTGLAGQEICCRYETPAQKQFRATQGKKFKLVRGETRYFRKVGETPQLRHALGDIPADGEAIVYVTEKLHGTSGRYGRVLEPQPQPWWAKLLRRPERAEYQYLNGSRNVILEHRADDSSAYYGSDQFRFDAVAGINLHKGETIFFELVGDIRPGTPIMPAHPVKDIALRNQYGEKMRYRYGTEEGTFALYVYRIQRTNEDGVTTELSWAQMVGRCQELGLKTVPLLLRPQRLDDTTQLTLASVGQLEGASSLDPTHIREGVVYRIEHPTGIRFVKDKSFTFKVLEGIIREDENYLDLEEAA